MLIVTTDIPCPENGVATDGFDRVEVVVSRGSAGAVTFAQTWFREECLPDGSTDQPRAPLALGREMRLGIVDSARSDARVRVEVRGRTVATNIVSSVAETDFVDGKVYGLRVRLAAGCINPPQCGQDATCFLNSDGVPSCGNVYRPPGSAISAVE